MRGYYSADGRFVEDAKAGPALVMDRAARARVQVAGVVALGVVTSVMVIVTLAILTFRLLMTASSQFERNAVFNPSSGPIIGAVLNTVRSPRT